MKWQMPAQQRRLAWLDRCLDKLGLPARSSGAISEKMPKLRKICPDKKGKFWDQTFMGFIRSFAEAQFKGLLYSDGP